MRKLFLPFLLVCCFTNALSQVTYIGITNHNIGTGTNNLFNHYVAVGQQCYIDWEVYAVGMVNNESCGSGSVSRLILRRMGENDSTSVVASAPIIVPGICAGKSGNNDHYYVDLSSYIDKPGRYSVEIQADLPNMDYPFENASTNTTCNYSCPSAYYLTGTGGPTGNYYTPAGNCLGGPGLSDPLGGQAIDKLMEVSAALKFFTVGEVGAYREMVVLNGNFYDLPKGKFQPGNPSLPVSINGTNGIPVNGICATQPAPALTLGGEVNSFKRTDCSNADVTSSTLYYRVYKSGNTPPAFAALVLDFKDDCPFNPNGPEASLFLNGGSCQNANGILDQRWQSVLAVPNILPSVFALSDTGSWHIDMYMQLTVVNCAGGAATTQLGDTVSTSFSVLDPQASGVQCNVVPVLLSRFTVSALPIGNLLNWQVQEALHVTHFELQRSFDGVHFNSIGNIEFIKNTSLYNYPDKDITGTTLFYRIIIHETGGVKLYSPIVRVNAQKGNASLLMQPFANILQVQLQHIKKGKYQLSIINTAGIVMLQTAVTIMYDGNNSLSLPFQNGMAKALYYAVLRDDLGNIVARRNFYY